MCRAQGTQKYITHAVHPHSLYHKFESSKLQSRLTLLSSNPGSNTTHQILYDGRLCESHVEARTEVSLLGPEFRRGIEIPTEMFLKHSFRSVKWNLENDTMSKASLRSIRYGFQGRIASTRRVGVCSK